jgi:hypothetical protein
MRVGDAFGPGSGRSGAMQPLPEFLDLAPSRRAFGPGLGLLDAESVFEGDSTYTLGSKSRSHRRRAQTCSRWA